MENEGLCQCGCKQKTPLAPKTNTAKGWRKGHPLPYMPYHSMINTRGPRKAERIKVEDRGYETPCHIWQLSKFKKGYGCEWDRNRGRMIQAHILAWERERGPVPDGLELDHLCRQRACVRVDHLEAVTHASNISRSAKRLPDLIIDQVLPLLDQGLYQYEVAERLGISQGTVSRIYRGKGPQPVH